MQTNEHQHRAIIIGGSTGIGRALAVELISCGYLVGVTARRGELLQQLHSRYPGSTRIRRMDIAEPETAARTLDELIRELGGVELIVINAGVGGEHGAMRWQNQQQVIDVNVRGVVAVLTGAYHYFAARSGGHIAVVTSVAALRGNRYSPVYSASKAFLAHYLQGLRQKVRRERTGILLTDICPGFVDTDMVAGRKGLFWVASPQTAARQIVRALRRRRTHVYITRRWRLVGWLLKLLPDGLYNRL